VNCAIDCIQKDYARIHYIYLVNFVNKKKLFILHM
jgi:hypothetical protein